MGNSSVKEEIIDPNTLVNKIVQTANSISDVYTAQIDASKIPFKKASSRNIQPPQQAGNKQRGQQLPNKHKRVQQVSDKNNVCANIEYLYKNQLLNLKKISLNNVASDLRLQYNQNKKEVICDAIIEHFRDRLTLVRIITDSLDFCNQRINNFNQGGFCANHNPTFNKDQCTAAKFRWHHVDDVLSSNKILVDQILLLKKKYVSYLTKLNGILEKLQTSIVIDSATLDRMKSSAETIIREMQINMDKYYIEIVKNIVESSNAARLDALRITKGLQMYLKNPHPVYSSEIYHPMPGI
jgi:hypothetical protein